MENIIEFKDVYKKYNLYATDYDKLQGLLFNKKKGIKKVASNYLTFSIQKGEKVALVATGLMVQEALEAAKKMETAPTVVNIHTIKPIDKELIIELAKTHDTIVTCEEHSIIGGLGSAVAEVLAEAGTACKLVRVGVQDVFGESGKPAELFAKYKIDADAIVEAATK